MCLGEKIIIHAMHLPAGQGWEVSPGIWSHCDLDQWTGEGESLPGLGSVEKGEEWERENIGPFFFFFFKNLAINEHQEMR